MERIGISKNLNNIAVNIYFGAGNIYYLNAGDVSTCFLAKLPLFWLKFNSQTQTGKVACTEPQTNVPVLPQFCWPVFVVPELEQFVP